MLPAVIAAIAAILAQSNVPPRLHFEVASVRRNTRLACAGRWDFRSAHGAVVAQNAPLLRIVSRAFNLTDDRVSGPGWLDSACFDIQAKAPKGASDNDLPPMLQALLAERLHMMFHRETAERAVFVLTVDPAGSKLRPYGDNVEVPPPGQDRKVLFMVRHLPDLCERIGKVLGRPVIDRTGLAGDYMIVLTYLPFGDSGGDFSTTASDIESAVRDQLGLRIESQRAPVEIVKIDSIDKTPSEN